MGAVILIVHNASIMRLKSRAAFIIKSNLSSPNMQCGFRLKTSIHILIEVALFFKYANLLSDTLL